MKYFIVTISYTEGYGDRQRNSLAEIPCSGETPPSRMEVEKLFAYRLKDEMRTLAGYTVQEICEEDFQATHPSYRYRLSMA